MTAPTVSVVVVSLGRPAALVRCLWGIEQLFHPGFELVVVADPEGLAAVEDAGFSALKRVAFDQPNISAARNLGLAEAAGEIVAFIDDDAVPEPTWLDRLIAPFSDSRVASAGGFVRGRNGISYQYIGAWVETTGAESAKAEPGCHAPRAGLALKTMGTNCAFRRAALDEIGGFDPALRFYLDETDVNMRLARAGHHAALVAEAQLHHGFLPSRYRASTRAPRDLYEIGASLAVFLRKHHPGRLWSGL